MSSSPRIVATIGPASLDVQKLGDMMRNGMNVARLNLAWGTPDDHAKYIKVIREASEKAGLPVAIMLDLPGPRISTDTLSGHTYDHDATTVLTDEDKQYIKFGVEKKVDFISVSYVRDEKDINLCRELIASHGGNQKIIAKIERTLALESLESIVDATDMVMVARGDLGNDVPIETLPYVQMEIIKKANIAGKPVITATQMMLSMVNSPIPTRAEVTDVAFAILQGSDFTMLSEETTIGKYPVETVTIMKKIIVEAEKHRKLNGKVNFQYSIMSVK